MALLAIDIGNTHIKVGIYEDLQMLRSFRLATSQDRTGDEYGVLLSGMLGDTSIQAAIIATVVPPVGTEIGKMVKQRFGIKPIFVSPVDMNLMPINMDYPREVGVDRIVNSYAGKKDYGCPLIVIDFGTATTFDVISAEGTYEGGAIAAGVEISAEALFERTALLPRVRLKKPDTEIGKNTREALQIGLYEGLLGQVEFIIQRFRRVLGEKTRVIATGGLAEEMNRECSLIDQADPDLSLRGLAMIYQDKVLNRSGAENV